MKRFQGKSVIVTGGGSGIGQATARKLSKEGAKVMLVGRTGEKLDKACESIKSETQGDVRTLAADVSKLEDNKRMVKETVDAFGSLDHAFLNAGVMRENKLSEATEDDFDYLFNNNTKGLFFGLQTVANAMRGAGTKGSIVAISSVMGHEVRVTVNMTKSIYGATKAANDILMKYAAGEYAEHGIRINAIAPGMVYTAMADAGSPEKTDETGAKLQLAGRAGRPGDIANLAAFLLSDEADFMYGVVYDAEGGYAEKA